MALVVTLGWPAATPVEHCSHPDTDATAHRVLQVVQRSDGTQSVWDPSHPHAVTHLRKDRHDTVRFVVVKVTVQAYFTHTEDVVLTRLACEKRSDGTEAVRLHQFTIDGCVVVAAALTPARCG
jgi:hypothetical protein